MLFTTHTANHTLCAAISTLCPLPISISAHGNRSDCSVTTEALPPWQLCLSNDGYSISLFWPLQRHCPRCHRQWKKQNTSLHQTSSSILVGTNFTGETTGNLQDTNCLPTESPPTTTTIRQWQQFKWLWCPTYHPQWCKSEVLSGRWNSRAKHYHK